MGGEWVAEMSITIWRRRLQLDKERREFMGAAMKDFDIGWRESVKALQDECEQMGHNYQFTNTGPLGHAWFSCTFCLASKVVRES